MTFDRRLVILSALSTLALPQVALSDDAPIKLRELYNKDKSLSDLALSREGARTTFEGFMAPPLKADAGFFVLTKQPMATCPFAKAASIGRTAFCRSIPNAWSTWCPSTSRSLRAGC